MRKTFLLLLLAAYLPAFGAVPTPVGTPTVIEGTGSSNNASHTVNASAEITIIDVVAYLSAGSITRPTVTMTGETVTFVAERFGQFSTANDQYAGRFYVDSPGSGAKTVTVTFASATAQTNVAYDYDGVNDSADPFTANVGVEGSDNNPTGTITTDTDSEVLATFGYYNETRSSINDGGTNINLDENGSSYISRSTHSVDGSASSTSPDITIGTTGEWVGILSALAGVPEGGGGNTPLRRRRSN